MQQQLRDQWIRQARLAAITRRRTRYEQVMACVNLDELHALEQIIALLASELDGVDPTAPPGSPRS